MGNQGFFNTQNMNIRDIKQIITERFNLETDRLAAEVLLREVLQIDQVALFTSLDRELSPSEQSNLSERFVQLEEGKPLAQILRKKEFYGRDFLVTEAVLIPRPESELVVDLALEWLKSWPQERELRLVDVGTGSGNILASLVLEIKKTWPNLRFSATGIDVSAPALQVAQENLAKYDLSAVNLVTSDLFTNVQSQFDLVLANLPYIGRERFNFVAANTEKFEPAVALFGGADGLDLYRQMLAQIVEWQPHPSLVIGEFGFGQKAEMENILANVAGEYTILDDLAGIPRVFQIKKFK